MGRDRRARSLRERAREAPSAHRERTIARARSSRTMVRPRIGARECVRSRARGSGVKTPLEVMVFARVGSRTTARAPREGREERRRRRERTNKRREMK